MRLEFAVLSLTIVLSSCAEFPALDGTVSPTQANEPIPDLVPLHYLIQQANTAGIINPFVEPAITQRLAKLRVQADHLRDAVISMSARSHMQRDVQIHGQ